MKSIKRIFHISDVHIRLFTRHDEYKQIFEKLYCELQKYDCESSICALTGDIVHSKNDMSPELEVITFDFFRRLSEICPTFVIAGNHDALLNNRDRMDSISSIIYKRKLENFYYLKDTGIYEYENIKFYVDSLLDEEKIDMTEDFCDDFIHVGLYHGSIKGWRNLRGFVSPTGENHLENFSGLDYLLLGDIHLFQYMSTEKKPIAAYASSLISQNFHEVDKNHGFLIWDLETKTQKYVPIENEYRYQLVQIADDGSLETDGETSLSIESIPLAEKGHIKVIGSKDEIASRNTFDYLKRKYPNVSFSFDIHEQQSQISQETPRINQEILNSENDLIVQFIQSKVEKEQQDEITNYILRIFNENHHVNNGVVYHLKELEFSNMFGYGANNKINLENYQQSIIGIFGENAHGKSSLIDIITMLLYDKLTRYSHGASIPKEVIHFNETEAFGKLTISIGMDTYKIEKFYTRNETNGKISLRTKFFIETEKGKKKELTGEQRSRTNKLIQDILGGYETFVFFNMFLQQRENSFREMTSLKRKQFLNSIYGYGFLEQYEKLHKDKLKELEIEYNLYAKKQSEKTNLEYESEKKKVNASYVEFKEKISKKKEELTSCEENINKMNLELSGGLDDETELKDRIDQIQSQNKELKLETASFEAILEKWNEFDYVKQFDQFQDDSLFLELSQQKNAKQLQDIWKNIQEIKNEKIEKIDQDLKHCYAKYNEDNLQVNYDRKILNLFDKKKKVEIREKCQTLQDNLEAIQINLKTRYNELHHPLDLLTDQNHLENKKKEWGKEVKQFEKKIKQIDIDLLSYEKYKDFIGKVNIDDYREQYQQWKDNDIFQNYSPFFASSNEKKWYSYQKEFEFVQNHNYQEEKKKIDEIECEIQAKNEAMIQLHFNASQNTITDEKYQHLSTFLKGKEFFYIPDSKFEQEYQRWQKYILKKQQQQDKITLYEENIAQCGTVEINKDCPICVKNKLYQRIQTFQQEKKQAEKTLRQILEKVENIEGNLQTMLQTFVKKDKYVEQYFVDKKLQVFYDEIQSRQKKIEKYEPLVMHYEKNKIYKKIRKEVSVLKKQKEDKNQLIEKIVFFMSHQKLFDFLNDQWRCKLNHEVLPFLTKELQTNEKYNDLLDEKQMLKTDLQEKQKSIEEETKIWEKDLLISKDIIQMEENLKLYSQYNCWLAELEKYEKLQKNDFYQGKITELEAKKKYCDLSQNKMKLLLFLKTCLSMKNWYEKTPSEWRSYLVDMDHKIQENRKTMELLEKNLVDLEHDVEILAKLNHFKNDKTNTKKILEGFEYEMTSLRCKLEEIQINQAIWNETNSKMYESKDKIQKEKNLIKILEKDGLPLFLLRKKISQVEVKLNEMIQPFINKKVRFDSSDDKNTIEFGFLTENNHLCSFVSGMESFILDICLKFCLSYFYIRPKSDFFIIDEKISVLDKNKLANVELLFDFLKSTSTNVLLISHIEQIKDFVDKGILITKKNQKSNVMFS